jgi:hypothetical protein
MKQIFMALILSVTAQIFIALKIYWLVHAFGERISLSQSIFASLLVFMASWLPISIGGLGIREGTILISLVFFGVTEQVAFMVAIAGRVIIYCYAAIGWVLFSQEVKELD